MQDHLPLMRTSERRDVAPRQAGPCLAGDNRDEIPVQRAGVIQRICDIVVAECKTIFGHRMISLVLTGSAARGEATIGKTEEGWKLSGDVEFLVVVGRTSERADSRAVAQIKQQAAKKLRTQGVDVAIDIAVATPSYFQALPPHIFSNELRSCGKIVAGDLTVLGLIPKIAAQEISREDAWRLLCNRMIEQLSFVNDLENSTTELTPRLHYATVKLYLDMATSYLVFTGHYAPTYQERAVRLTALAAQSKERAPFPLAKFASRVVECTSWKLSGDEETCNRSIEFWHEGISYMRRLWRWEMIQMTEGTSEVRKTTNAQAALSRVDIRCEARWMAEKLPAVAALDETGDSLDAPLFGISSRGGNCIPPAVPCETQWPASAAGSELACRPRLATGSRAQDEITEKGCLENSYR
jgi:hypothetical protein